MSARSNTDNQQDQQTPRPSINQDEDLSQTLARIPDKLEFTCILIAHGRYYYDGNEGQSYGLEKISLEERMSRLSQANGRPNVNNARLSYGEQMKLAGGEI